MSDGTLVTVGGAPLTAGARIDANRPEFATADGRLLVLQIESAGQILGVFEVLAPRAARGTAARSIAPASSPSCSPPC
jgi:hypothetical protein